MELAVKAGYSFNGGLGAMRKMIDLGLNYSSFEGLSSDHPSWYDRIAQLDKEQASTLEVFGLVPERYLFPCSAELRSGTTSLSTSDEAVSRCG